LAPQRRWAGGRGRRGALHGGARGPYGRHLGGEDSKKDASSAPTASPGGYEAAELVDRGLRPQVRRVRVGIGVHIEAFKRSGKRRGGVFDGTCALSRRASGCTTRCMTDVRPGERVVTGRARRRAWVCASVHRSCAPMHGRCTASCMLCVGSARGRAWFTRRVRAIVHGVHAGCAPLRRGCTAIVSRISGWTRPHTTQCSSCSSATRPDTGWRGWD